MYFRNLAIISFRKLAHSIKITLGLNLSSGMLKPEAVIAIPHPFVELFFSKK